jgi:hypothetical protein
MQKVYLDEKHCLGDDETTIIFTQNATRIVINPCKNEKEHDDEATANENNEAHEYERLSLELAPTFEGMMKEMMALPDSHDAWAYMNPTMYHLGDQSTCNNLTEREAQHVKDFQNWLDGTLFVNHELTERTESPQKQSSQMDMVIRTRTIEDNTFTIRVPESQGSSSIEIPPSPDITWGERKSSDREESLRMWLQTNMPKAEKRKEDTHDDSNLEEMTVCSVCEKEMPTINPGINTCIKCQQWINESLELNTKKEDNNEDKDSTSTFTRTQNDDEQELVRIPIAGENESDYEDSDEYEEEEDSLFPDRAEDDLEDTNSNNTEDSDVQSLPIVIALSGPATDDIEQADGKTDSETEDDSMTIATMINETTEEQQQNSSSETTSIFTTPDKRKTKFILNLLKHTTQTKLQLQTFDVATAFLNESKFHVSSRQ